MSNRLEYLGKRIAKIRRAKKISQIDLSLDVGIDRAYLSEIENGRTNTTINILYALADALEVDITEFFAE